VCSTVFSLTMDAPTLPFHLKTKNQQDAPSVVFDRLNFLWNSAIAAASASSLQTNSLSHMAHRLSQRFIEVAKNHKIEVPAIITERLCRSCSAFLIPSVSVSIRLRRRSRRSKANKGDKERVRNEFVRQTWHKRNFYQIDSLFFYYILDCQL
jgi:RNase P subunit RPR2